MAEDLNADVGISLETDKFKKGSDSIQKELDEIKNKTKSSASDIDQSFDKIGDSAQESARDVEDFGDKADKALEEYERAAKEAEGASTTFAVSVLGLAQAFGGAIQQALEFDKKLVALDKTIFGLEGQTLALARSKEDLTLAMREGTIGGRDLQRALEDIAMQEKAVALETRNVKAEQQALTGEYANFALNIGQTVIFTLTSITSMKALMAKRSAAAALQQTLETGATKADTLAKSHNTVVQAGNTGGKVVATGVQGGLTASIWGGVAAVKAMTISMLMSPLAPFAIAAIAAGAAFLAYETNLLGARDAIEDLTGQERGSLPTLTNGMFDLSMSTQDAYAETDTATQSLETMQIAAESLGLTLEEYQEAMKGGVQVTESLGGALITTSSQLRGIASEFGGTSEAIFAFHQQLEGVGVEDLSNRMNALTLSIFSVKDSLDPLSAEFKLAKEAILPEIQDIASGMDGTFGKAATDNWLANLKNLGILGAEDLARITKEIRAMEQAAKDLEDQLKKNNDELAHSKANRGSRVSSEGGFIITDDGRAINIGNDGPNISGSLGGEHLIRSNKTRKRRKRSTNRFYELLVKRWKDFMHTKGNINFGFMSPAEIAAHAGISIPFPTFPRFGNNDPRFFESVDPNNPDRITRKQFLLNKFNAQLNEARRKIQERIHFAIELNEFEPDVFGGGTLGMLEALKFDPQQAIKKVQEYRQEIRDAMEWFDFGEGEGFLHDEELARSVGGNIQHFKYLHLTRLFKKEKAAFRNRISFNERNERENTMDVISHFGDDLTPSPLSPFVKKSEIKDETTNEGQQLVMLTKREKLFSSSN